VTLASLSAASAGDAEAATAHQAVIRAEARAEGGLSVAVDL
jgi:hypothetical protein